MDNRANFSQFLEGIINIATVYLPHQFAPMDLLRTLFAPWKGITTEHKERGFSMNDSMNVFMGNMISRTVGATARGGLIWVFLFAELFLFLVTPFLIIGFFLISPFRQILSVGKQTPQAHKAALKEGFLKNHVIDPQFQPAVDAWFEREYRRVAEGKEWWRAETMKRGKPFGADWVAGYTVHLDEYTTPVPEFRDGIGRATEIAAIEQELIRSHGSNIVLVGDDGVGKATLLTMLSHYLQTPQAHDLIRYKRMLELNVEHVMASTTDHTQRILILENLLVEAEKAGNIILVIPNIHLYTSSKDPSTNLASSIEKFANSPQLTMVGTTTPYHYAEVFGRDNTLSESFHKVEILEMGKEDILTILTHQALLLEHRYGQLIPYDTLVFLVDKSEFYFADKPFPGKALKLLEDMAIAKQKLGKGVITPDDVNTIITQEAHVPTSLNDEMKGKLVHIEEALEKTVIGQEQASKEVAGTLQRAFIQLGKRKKPLASFLFLGPTGVGKTETAKVLAQTLFDTTDTMMRFDMSLYQEKDDIGKLIGDGEKGLEGQLTMAIQKHPYGILLLDELEKAHKDIFSIFLTLLDEGYITDGFGKKIDGKNLIIVATSNAGVDYMMPIFKSGTPMDPNGLIQYLITTHVFSPEFLNRFDGIIAFNKITTEAALIIARSMLSNIQNNMMELHGVTLQVSDAYLQNIIQGNFNDMFGARNLEHALRTNIESVVAKMILEGTVQKGQSVLL